MPNLKSYDHFSVLATPKSPQFRKIDLAQTWRVGAFWSAENDYEVRFPIPLKLRESRLRTP